jgi:hypothetical protein
MAAKKKSTKKAPDAKKSLDGMEKATKALQLHIKELRKSLGHPFHERGAHFGGAAQGHRFTK